MKPAATPTPDPLASLPTQPDTALVPGVDWVTPWHVVAASVVAGELFTVIVLVVLGYLRHGGLDMVSLANGVITSGVVSFGVSFLLLRILRHLQASLDVIGAQRRLIEQAESARTEMQARLLIADRMASLGTLAGGVAHEINNPLSFVMGNMEVADDELRALSEAAPGLVSSVEELREMLRESRVGAERIRDIVRDLRTFSRAEDDTRKKVDLRRVLELSINMARNEIRHRASLVEEYEDVPEVEGNESRLGQVFVNLLVNAAHAIPEGNADRNQIRVAIRMHASGSVAVEIHDSGSGMSPETRARIFDPFFTTKPVGSGTGLGLAICHGIVSALGGKIEVDTAVGKGSCFRVLLPPALAIKPFVPVDGLATDHRPAPLNGRLLIVDDEPLLVEILVRMLETDHDVVGALDGRRALERITDGERFDAIVCDLMMPHMTGMELYEKLAAIAPDQAERMIFVSGGAFTTRAREFMNASTNPLVDKPFRADTVRSVVNEVVARGRPRNDRFRAHNLPPDPAGPHRTAHVAR